MVLPVSHRVSRVPWYSGNSTEDWLVFTYRAFTVFGGAFQPPSVNVQFCDFLVLPEGPVDSYNPVSTTAWAYHMYTVWAIPISLAATTGIAFFAFYSSGYLDVSVPPLTSVALLQTKRSFRRE